MSDGAEGEFLSVHDNKLTNSPLSFLSRGQIEDIHLTSSIWLVISLDVYREFLDKGAGVPEERQTHCCFGWKRNMIKDVLRAAHEIERVIYKPRAGYGGLSCLDAAVRV